MLRQMTTKVRKILILTMLALLAGRLLHTAQQKSATFDEPAHISAGYYYLIEGDFRPNVEHPPLLKLISASLLAFLGVDKREIEPIAKGPPGPLELAQAGVKFLHGNGFGYWRTLLAARLPIMALALLGGMAIYFWSKELFGYKAALFSLFLYTFGPEILAHGSLATTDLGAATLMIISAWLFWRLITKGGHFNLIAAGLAFGLALGSKFTSLVLVPIFAIEALAVVKANKFFDMRRVNSNQPGKEGDITAKELSFHGSGFKFIGFFLISLVALASLYKFYQFPLYFEGLMRQWSHSSMGHPAFLAGTISDKGWPHYFLLAFTIKTPLALLILLILVIISQMRGGRSADIFLLLPPAAILIVASMSRLDIGLRLILPVYPFLFIFVGEILSKWPGGIWQRWSKRAVIPLALWYGASSLIAHPDYLAYFNELIGGSRNGSLYLVDSNLDWGQDLLGLKRYMQRNKLSNIYLSYFGTDSPGAHGISYKPLPPMEARPHIERSRDEKDFLAISATYLRGLYLIEPSLYDWLAKRKPAASIGGSIFIFDLKGDPAAHLSLVRLYAAYGRCLESSPP